VIPEVPEFDDGENRFAMEVPAIAGAGYGGRRDGSGVRVTYK